MCPLVPSTCVCACNLCSALEKELASLIMDGQIQARIDSQAEVLYARHADVRAQTFARVLATGESYIRESKALLLRASLIKHELIQRGARQRPAAPHNVNRGGDRGEALPPHFAAALG